MTLTAGVAGVNRCWLQDRAGCSRNRRKRRDDAGQLNICLNHTLQRSRLTALSK
jgi:hypothetical protein